MVHENKFKGLYIIGYGLGGSFGGQRNFEVIQVDTQEQADQWAYESACEEYDRYEGMYGLRTLEQIMEEDAIEDESEAEDVWSEERDGWIVYSAVPYSKEREKEVENHHYDNPYRELTD